LLAAGAAPPPHDTRSMDAITIKLRIKGNLLFIFSLLLNLDGRFMDAKDFPAHLLESRLITSGIGSH
jgi:hypothetical protein